MSAFAEILKGSPYAARERLDDIGAVVRAPEHQTPADRAEFATLFDLAVPLLHAVVCLETGVQHESRNVTIQVLRSQAPSRPS